MGCLRLLDGVVTNGSSDVSDFFPRGKVEGSGCFRKSPSGCRGSRLTDWMFSEVYVNGLGHHKSGSGELTTRKKGEE